MIPRELTPGQALFWAELITVVVFGSALLVGWLLR